MSSSSRARVAMSSSAPAMIPVSTFMAADPTLGIRETARPQSLVGVNLSGVSELEAVVRARSASFEVFYEAHHDVVRRSLTAAFGDPSLAEDAEQEAFARAYLHWSRVARMERPAGWVYVVAVRFGLKQ